VGINGGEVIKGEVNGKGVNGGHANGRDKMVEEKNHRIW
jgi:hypothetical protein